MHGPVWPTPGVGQLLRTDLLENAGEELGLLGGELRKDFAVEFYAARLKLIDEGGVRLMAVLAHGGVEPDYPERAEVVLLVPAVGEGVAAGLHEALMCLLNFGRAAVAIALSALEDILLALLRHHSALDSCHRENLNV